MYTPELFGKATDQEPAVRSDVSMFEYKRIDVPRDDNGFYVLKTVGRAGCDAVLVWRLDTEGNDQILMTHYPPTELDYHISVLEKFSPKGDGVIRTVLLTSGYDDSDYWVEQIRETLKGITGIRPDLISIPLTRMPFNLPEDILKDPLLYQLCATRICNGHTNNRRIEVRTKDLPTEVHSYYSQF